VKEKGGFAFISTVKLHFSLVSNPKYAGKVNFTVSKNKPTHFLHLCGNPSKKIVIEGPVVHRQKKLSNLGRIDCFFVLAEIF